MTCATVLDLCHTLGQAIQSEVRLGVPLQFSHPAGEKEGQDSTTIFCNDFRKLNSKVIFDAEPRPDLDQRFNSLRDAKYTSKFDMTEGL